MSDEEIALRERKPNEIQRLLALRQGLKKLNEAAILRRSSDSDAMPEKPPPPKEVQPEKIPSWKKMLRRSSENLAADSKVAEEPEVVLKKPKNIKSEDHSSNELKTLNELAEEKNAESAFMKETVCNKDVSELPEPSSPTEVSFDAQSQGKSRKFLPPLRDEESELQRKAHAKRVRETRRSTQGVLLEDLKTAELQHLIKATQEVNRALEREHSNEKTTCDEKDEQPLARLSASESLSRSSPDPTEDDECNEKKSGELRNHSSDSISTAKSADPSSQDTSPSVTLVLRPKPSSNSDEQSSPDNKNSQATQAAIQRRRRPKRRSTGVVYLDSDDATEDKEVSDKDKSQALPKEKNEDEKEDASSTSDRARQRYGSSAYQDVSSEASSRSETPSKYSSHSSMYEDSDKDYKKLYQDLKRENERLRDVEKENERLRGVEKETTQLKETVKRTQEELERTKTQLKKLNEANNTRNAVSESEKRERRALERKLSEMEEEVKSVYTWHESLLKKRPWLMYASRLPVIKSGQTVYVAGGLAFKTGQYVYMWQGI